jgi:acetoin utilization deacetylase AcuC-like enzyme
VPSGSGDDVFCSLVEHVVVPLGREYRPTLVLISAGFDSLRGDPLGGFTLEMEHVDLLTRWLVDAARSWCGGRLVSALEGGYNTDRLGEACAMHLDSLQ